jgi:hypothetical protein
MNIGYDQILQMRRAEAKANELGFMFAYPKHGWGGDGNESRIALRPKDADSLPIFSRDAQMFSGTLYEAEIFMMGIEWARQYDEMLRVSTKVKRDRKEQDVRNKKLVAILKGENDQAVQT